MMELSKSKGIELNSDSYNRIIGLYGLMGDLTKMRDCYTEMKKKNVEITKKAFAGMLVGYLVHVKILGFCVYKQGSLSESYHLIKEMNNIGLPVNTSAMNYFLNRFKSLGI